MRTTLFLIGFCIMTNIASLGQDNKYLKSGVYEYRNISNMDTLSKHKNWIDADSTVQNIKPLVFWNFVSTRKLILKINEDSIVARYIISDFDDIKCARRGTRSQYLLNLKIDKNNLFKAKTENIELSIYAIDENKIEVEVLSGIIAYYYSGGQYLEHNIPLSPEKQVLTFTRELTAKDEDELK